MLSAHAPPKMHGRGCPISPVFREKWVFGSGCRTMPALSLTPVGFGKYSLDSGGSGCNARGLSDVEASIRAALSISCRVVGELPRANAEYSQGRCQEGGQRVDNRSSDSRRNRRRSVGAGEWFRPAVYL